MVWAKCRASCCGLYRSICAWDAHHLVHMPVRAFCARCLCVLCVLLCVLGFVVLQVAFLVSWHLVVVSVPSCGGIRLRAGLLSVHGRIVAGFCDL